MSETRTEFGGSCSRLATACRDALDWLEDNRERVGTNYESVLRTLKRGAVEAGRLDRAADRPMSVGIFGPSQVGKSFLSDTLILGADEARRRNSLAGRVVFGSGEELQTKSFVEQINPQGGQETTGLVTRFTRHPVETPAGYPVALRLLRETDLVKILANTFVHDLSGDSVKPLTLEYVRERTDELAARAEGSFSDNLEAEDVYELEDYFEKSLQKHPITKDSAMRTLYWSLAERTLPRLKPADRAEFLSLLWGEVEGFTEIFVELKAALDQLGHPEIAYAPMASITDRNPDKTILHVLTMKQGLDPGTGSGETAQLVSRTGASATLRKPVVTALVLELTLQLEEPGWPFFQNADLLDFPGARSRADQNREKFFQDTAKEFPLGEAFLRGKVAVLFDKYAADFDLNAMVACHKAEKIEVTSFPSLVEEWVRRTQGATAEERAGKSTNLFMAVTFCDSLFNVSAGETDKEVAISNKLNVLSQFSPSTEEWVPGQPFRNSYLIRNPSGTKLPELFDYLDLGPAKWQETGHREGAAETLREYREAFLSTETGQRYFDDPGDTWDKMVAPDDGGVTLVAERLAGACEPAVKRLQMSPKGAGVAQLALVALKPYHESGDLAERRRLRLEAIGKPVAVMDARKHLVPSLITEFQISVDLVASAYTRFWQSRQRGGVSGYVESSSFADVVFRAWSEETARRRDNEAVMASYGLSAEAFQTIASEIERGAVLAELPERLTRLIADIEAYDDTTEKRAGRVGRSVALLFNEFVSQLGCTGRTRLPAETDIAPLAPVHEIGESGLPEFSDDLIETGKQRDALLRAWLDGLLFLTETNAGHASGGLVDVEQNERLGGIIVELERVERELTTS